MTIIEKLVALRALMRENGLSAYIVPGTDPHASEYMAAHWTETTWLSGFKGEAGTVVVTLDKARLFTDSRYYLQAGIELRGTTIELMRASDIDCPSINEWLISSLTSNSPQGGLVVGVNPEMWSVNEYKAMKEEFAEAGIGLKSVDLIRPLWTEGRPAIPETPLYGYDVRFAGESVASKLTRIREKMAEKKASAMVISALDEIAWLLNIRGYDVEFNPVVISYVVLESDKVTLFVNSKKVDAAAAAYLSEQGIAVREYEEVFEYISRLQGTVLYDGAKVNEALYEAIRCEKRNAQSPILVAKSHKNEVELEGERKAMRQDGAALTRFLMWLEKEALLTPQTEITLMDRLHEERLKGENFVEESFGTIAGWKGNGAIVHYAATPDNCATIEGEGVLLLDSGGQYLDGTTDITRTMWIGNPANIPAQAKRDYTYVLKGHIALGKIRWPRGTRGNQLDALAKQYMWAAGITFGHGTGHGVGHFLGCHEGPQNVRTDMNPTVLEPGQICSDEPGIYRTGEWGIRIENLVAVTPVKKTEVATTEDEWLTWEHLTLCPYDTNMIDFSLLAQDEIEWINAYHEKVYAEVSSLLTAEEAAWLQDKCKAI